MTLSTTTNIISFMGSGTTGPFTIPFKFLNNSDIVVTKRSSGGTITDLSEGSDYSLTGAGSASGGILNLYVALATGELLTITRTVPLVQPLSLPNQGPYFATTIEQNFDRLVMMIQQLEAAVVAAGVIGAVTKIQCLTGEYISPFVVTNTDGSYTIEWEVVG